MLIKHNNVVLYTKDNNAYKIVLYWYNIKLRVTFLSNKWVNMPTLCLCFLIFKEVIKYNIFCMFYLCLHLVMDEYNIFYSCYVNCKQGVLVVITAASVSLWKTAKSLIIKVNITHVRDKHFVFNDVRFITDVGNAFGLQVK